MQLETPYNTNDTPSHPDMQGVFSPLEWSIIATGRQADKRHAELQTRSARSVRFEFQGGLVKVAGRKLRDGVRRVATQRGLCLDFSRRSRVNLMEKFARIDWKHHKAIFITLTYHNRIPDERTAKQQLRAFLKRLWRDCGNCATVWRMEYQPKRGAVHFHLILFDMNYIPWGKLLQMWRDVTGDETITQTRVNMLDSPAKAQRYLAKYLAKVEPTVSGHTAEEYLSALCLALVLGILDNLPYLAASHDQQSPGRFWGIEQRALLPYAELTIVTIADRVDLLHCMKRAMRHVFKRTNGVRFCGARLFTINAQRWLEWLEFTVLSE